VHHDEDTEPGGHACLDDEIKPLAHVRSFGFRIATAKSTPKNSATFAKEERVSLSVVPYPAAAHEQG